MTTTPQWEKQYEKLWKLDGQSYERIKFFIRSLVHQARAQREREVIEQATVVFNTVHCKNCQKKAKKLLSHLQETEEG